MSQGWNPLPAPPQLPFQPPPQYVQPPPRPKPSGFYKAIGIIQIILGVGGVFYSLITVVTLGFTTRMSAGIYDAETTAALMAVTGIYVLTGALLLVTGIGVVKARRWSRITGVVYAVLSLLDTFSNAALQVLVIQPRTLGRIGGLGSSSGFELFMYVTVALSVLVAAVVPVATLVILGRPGARAELDQ